MTKTKNSCPFCGFNSTQMLTPTSKPNTSTHAKGFQIECFNCGARGPAGMARPIDAVRVWDKGDGFYSRPCVQDLREEQP